MAATATAETEEVLCYCPGAVRALMWSAEQLDQARRELQRKDANYNATEALKAATRELEQTRVLLERAARASELEERASALLARVEGAMPRIDRIEAIVRMLDESEVVFRR